MPELPEVETVRIGLNENTLGWQIEGGEVLLPRAIAYPENSEAFLAAVIGAEFTEWQRRGKYLIAQLSQGDRLGVHLRMTGSLLWYDRDTAVGKHTRVRLFLKEKRKGKKEKKVGLKELRFDDQRTFGKVWWVPSHQPTESIITGLQNLGLEPFDPEFTSEKAANSLSLEQVISLRLGIIRSLSDGIAKGGTTFSSFQNVAGLKGNYINTAWVFRRTGQPCNVCGTLISRIKLGGRSTHFCSQCQSL